MYGKKKNRGTRALRKGVCRDADKAEIRTRGHAPIRTQRGELSYGPVRQILDGVPTPSCDASKSGAWRARQAHVGCLCVCCGGVPAPSRLVQSRAPCSVYCADVVCIILRAVNLHVARALLSHQRQSYATRRSTYCRYRRLCSAHIRSWT